VTSKTERLFTGRKTVRLIGRVREKHLVEVTGPLDMSGPEAVPQLDEVTLVVDHGSTI
jgi:hypothetical protein